MHEATRARIRQLQAEIADRQEEVRRFETRYGMSLARFEAEILAKQDSLQVHEDYFDVGCGSGFGRGPFGALFKKAGKIEHLGPAAC